MEWKRPKTFEEYFAAHPEFHKMWLNKNYPVYGRDEDMQQHLLWRSMHTSRVEKYDPLKRGSKLGPKGEDNIRLFLSYMAMCFNNDVKQTFAYRTSNKRQGLTLSLDERMSLHNAGDLHTVGDSLTLISQSYRQGAAQEGRRAEVSAQLQQFRDYLAEYRPDLLAVLNQCEEEGIMSAAVKHAANNFTTGKIIPKRRTGATLRIRRTGVKRLGAPRQFVFTLEQIEGVVHLSQREAAAVMRCSEATLHSRCRELTGYSWGEFRRLMGGRSTK